MHQLKCIDLWTVLNIKSKSTTCVALREVSELHMLRLLVGSTNQPNEMVYCEKHGGYSKCGGHSDAQNQLEGSILTMCAILFRTRVCGT